MNSTIVADSLASHSGKSDRREWHTVGAWLHPGERIVIVGADDAAREAAKGLLASVEMLAAVLQGAQEEFVRVLYGSSHEDVAQINDWHKMAAEALSNWEKQAAAVIDATREAEK